MLQNTIVPGDISRQDYLGFMGTSMASPHVAGVAALVVSQGVRDPDAVAKILKQTARRPVHYRGSHDNHYGAGIVDALAAVLEARAQVAMQSQTAQDVPPLEFVCWRFGLVAASLGSRGFVVAASCHRGTERRCRSANRRSHSAPSCDRALLCTATQIV